MDVLIFDVVPLAEMTENVTHLLVDATHNRRGVIC